MGHSSPELRRRKFRLRRTIARRRTACDFARSGQHSLTGTEQITETPPLKSAHRRKAATTSSPAGSSPELKRAQSLHLRRTVARRRTSCDFTSSSGQHSLTTQITGTPPPMRGLTGGKLATTSSGGSSSPELRRAKSAPPTNVARRRTILRFHAQLKPTFAHRSRANYRNPTSVEKSAHRSKAEGKLDTRRRQHFFDIIEAFHSTFVE